MTPETQPSNRVRIVRNDQAAFEGRVMPSSTEQTLVIKLDSGYNVGILRARIASTTDIPAEKMQPIENTNKNAGKKEFDKKEAAADKNLPKISILHTGGTIASKVDYHTGAVTARFEPQEILALFPELSSLCVITSKLISNMWTEDMRFIHYQLMCRAVVEEIKKGVAGIIITQGTDMLHYTGAALSFMIENSPVPIILVAAQRSSDRPSSDAGVNLVCAVHFITKTKFRGVGACMHEHSGDESCLIFPGTNFRKMHSSRRDAFKAVNAKPIARVHYPSGTVEEMTSIVSLKTSELVVREKMEGKIAILKMHPHMTSEQYQFYKGYRGLIIEGSGLAGNIPINHIDEHTAEHTKIADAIRGLIASGTIVAATTQTIFGRLNMNVYTTGRKMQEMGILGHGLDMTTETAFVKLAWLLGNFDGATVKTLYAQNLRGEMSERSLVEEDL